MSFSRRAFLASASALGCTCASHLQASGRSFPKLAVEAPVRQPLYHQIRLSEGRMATQMDQQHKLYIEIDDDRLLKPFRVLAGQAAPGADMGGWYDASEDFHIDPTDWSTANWHGYIPGHSFGQYLSGLARIYAITGDAATKTKVESLVAKYIPTISSKFFDDYNLPAYTYDKILIGLIDAYQYVGIDEAKAALDKVTDAALPYLPEKALTREERRERPYSREAQIWDEPYILPENLFIAWKLGMGERYKALALRFMQDDALFDPLAAGISPLAGKHAYSHVNALNSAVEAYLATGTEKYLKAALNGFDFIERQSYATGGWGPNEELVAADDTETLYDMLTATHRTFETPCGAYGHFKIARALLKLTKDSRYGDSMERVLYNTILGAKPTTPQGETFYYSDYHETATKFYRGELWPCCSGTFIQLTADYGISSYLSDDSGLYVNLYVPSKAQMTLGRTTVKLEQVTQYPLNDTSRIHVGLSAPARFAVHLRIPTWAGPETTVHVNGKEVHADIISGRFCTVSRLWADGDMIDIRLDMGLRLEPLNAAHPEMVALLTGPLVLFPIDPPQHTLKAGDWLGATRTGPEAWAIEAGGTQTKLLPFMAITDETYRLYNRIAG